MPLYKVNQPFLHLGEKVKKGDTVELTTEEATHLIAPGVIDADPIAPSKPEEKAPEGSAQDVSTAEKKPTRESRDKV